MWPEPAEPLNAFVALAVSGLGNAVFQKQCGNRTARVLSVSLRMGAPAVRGSHSTGCFVSSTALKLSELSFLCRS